HSWWPRHQYRGEQNFRSSFRHWRQRRLVPAARPDVVDVELCVMKKASKMLVQAIRVSTGLGKTRIAAKVISEIRCPHPATAPWVYLVPTHRLGDDVAKLFAEHRITAKVFRGREAMVPGKDKQMCLNLDQVRLALAAGEPIAET